MAVVGDNRGGSNSRVAQRPDGAWSFEDARRRREQRQAGPTASAHLRSGEADEDLSALALGLADSLTFDGTPLSQLDIHQDLDASTPERPADDAPTAEEIMRALEAEQRAAKATSDTGSLRTAHGPRSARSPHRPSTRRPHHRRLLPPRRWTIACSLLAAGLGVLAVQLASGTGPNPGGHPTRALASGATAPTSGLIEAAMNSFLGAEHAVDHRLNPPRARTTRTSRPRRPHHQLARVPNSTSPARSPSQSTSTASTTGASDSTGTTEQISQTSSTPPSSSTPSGSSQPPPTNQSHTAPHSNSSLRYPIQSGPPFAGHWSRQLQLPIARTHRTSTGR